MEKYTHHTCDTYTRTTYIGNIRVGTIPITRR